MVSAVKTFMLWVILLLISVVLITPVLLVNISTEIIANLDWNVPFLQNSNFNTYLTSAMTVFVNIILIPFLIDIMVLMEDHPTKSIRQLAILNRNYFFMLLNSFLIPLTFTTSIKAFLLAIKD
jgi:hypothetical protein